MFLFSITPEIIYQNWSWSGKNQEHGEQFSGGYLEGLSLPLSWSFSCNEHLLRRKGAVGVSTASQHSSRQYGTVPHKIHAHAHKTRSYWICTSLSPMGLEERHSNMQAHYHLQL
ncbi:hypothetical protein MPTK1_2g13370 [Marchantia polymorpha subsp. ruderalis]|uniref:Uncharacterized protein n=1 Tax=Marchantia polymorpha TaxID=3197 RepID=A0A2R6XAM0_MARPO|nr:hypothetical protein MARPO_0026s0035 [Marchantia polymorpha]BBN02175.1 hypothetical protein Mp_2g13370 [Marchantia polymorpha subsp. ruderalis]|eukprot:PTQ43144.1 hypothetical protein MARPO_0026s0035 [Marchantia polymorpha]